MDQTVTFILLTCAATLLISGIILGNRRPEASNKIAAAFYVLCIFFALIGIITTVLSVSGTVQFKGPLAYVFQIVIYRGWLVLGTGISTAILVLGNSFSSTEGRLTSDAVRAFISSRYVVKG